MCLLMQRQYEKQHAYRESGRQSHISRPNYGLDEYNRHSRISDGSHQVSEFIEDGGRMSHLMEVMSQSPYLQQVINYM